MGEGVEGGPRRAAMVAVPGARGELCSGYDVPGARGELCSGYDRDRFGLGEVKEGVGLLTVEAIEL